MAAYVCRSSQRSAACSELEQLTERIRPYLKDYLVEHGVEFDHRGYFKCINPEHDDSNPSSHLIPNSHRTKCFSCGASYDIFRVASLLEAKATAGPGWLHQNVYYLAKKYGIPFEPRELTEEELLYMRLAAIYDDAATFLQAAAEKGGEYTRAAEERYLTQTTCIKYGVASVPWTEFSKQLVTAGHDLELCKQYYISQEMFDSDRITLALRDPGGMVTGFARRWLPYSKEAEKLAKADGRRYPQKWWNTGNKVPFFDRNELVYGLHVAKKGSRLRLDVYEGYFDVLFAHQAGHTSSVCGSGTTLTEVQVQTMLDNGFSWLNLVYDGDAPGQAAARQSLEALQGREGLRATVMNLPFEDEVPDKDRDPDEFIRRYGLAAYRGLQPISAFEWRLWDLLAAGGEVSKSEIARQMVPLIINEPSPIERGRLVGILAEQTAVPADDVRAELARLTDARITNVAEQAVKQLSRAKDAVERRQILQSANQQLASFQDKPADFSAEESAQAFMDACDSHESARDALTGWDTGWPQFNANFDGIGKTEQIYAVAGQANCGKSAWITTLAANLLVYNQKGLTVIYHILDDPRKIAFAKLMSCLTGFPIKYIVKAAQYIQGNQAYYARYITAKQFLLDAMNSGRLIVKGRETGDGIQVAERQIEYAQQRYGNQIVYVADSFHSLDNGEGDDERIKYKRISEWAMATTELKKCSMVFTVELRKIKGDRATLEDLSESSKMSFAFKAIGLLYNDLHVRREYATQFWVDDSDPETVARRPILQIDWAKNKTSEYKGRQYLRFWDNVAKVAELTIDELKTEKEKAKQMKREMPNEDAIASLAAETIIPDLEIAHADSSGTGPAVVRDSGNQGPFAWDK